MKIKNWEKWQTYRQDRGAPPWIKVHRNLMSNSDWVGLTDAEKGQLVSMWIVAADKSGHLPDDPAMIRKMCILDGTPDINKFKRLGFIDAKRMPRRRQPDAPETEAETDKNKGQKKIEPDFVRFYTAYPKKKGKDQAEKAYNKLNGEAPSIDSLLEILDKHKKSLDWTRDDGKFIPHPATWLNQKRWEDEVTPTTSKSDPHGRIPYT